MLLKLADDVFYVVFINQEVVLHNGLHVLPLFCAVQDLLLVMEGNLRIRDKEGGDEGMGDPTLGTEHTLNGKPDLDRVKLNRTFVMSITNETAFLPTGTFHLKELQSIYHTIIYRLRKIIAFFKNNCYHDIGNSTKEHGF